MKRLTHSLPAKAAAIILTVLIAAGTLFCGIGSIFMFNENYYLSTEEQLLESDFSSIMWGMGQERLTCYVNGGDPLEIQSDNYYFTLYVNGEEVAGTYEGQPVQLKQEQGRRYWDDEELIETYSINGYLAETLTGTDAFTRRRDMVHTLFSLRYWAVTLTVIGVLLLSVLLIFLYCSAGRRAGVEGPVLNAFDRIPFDLYTVLLALGTFYGFCVCSDILYMDWVSEYIFFLLLFIIVLGYTMSLATRIKVGGLLRRTVIGRICCAVARLIRSLPLIWKTAVFLLVYIFVELFFLVVGFGAWPLLFLAWVVRTLAAVPLCLMIALALRRLQRGGQKLAEGDLDSRVETARLFGDFRTFGETLNSINLGMNRAVAERMKSERFKTELITNVSHDIKTPLTSIINYVDLIKKEEPENETLRGYIDVLDRQSARLKKLIEDLVEASKAATGALPVRPEPCNIGVLLAQVIGEYDERLHKNALDPVLRQPEEPVLVMADPRHLWRVLDNLMGNICKYAQNGTRVYLDLAASETDVSITFRNISREALNISGEELMERFVRGDNSRNTEGSGLGLSIAKSLCELQDGTLELAIDGDLFKVTVRFRRLQ